MVVWNKDAFIGGHPVLDFVNTVDDQDKQRHVSRISDWVSFLGWAQASLMFNEAQYLALTENTQDSDQLDLLLKIHEMRESMHAVLSTVLSGELASGIALVNLTDDIRTAICNATLVLENGTYQWKPVGNSPSWVLGVLALSMESLLRASDMARLRVCKRCSWMFLDKGRGRGRQWCNMNTCGNRAKSAAFRRRKA